jgi:large subunit ribosomal protein L22
LDWVREKLATGVKENQSEEEIQAAKEQAKKEGVSNVFEDVSAAKPKAEALIKSHEKGKKKGPSKSKPSAVRRIGHSLSTMLI